jgi:predicted dehydrogenase
MTILVLGCGSIGSRHARNLNRLRVADLVLFDPDRDRAGALGAQIGARAVAETAQGYAQDPRAVLICTPTSSHVPLAREAASRGCHVFIEKPLADSGAGTDELCATVRQRRLVSLVGCNMRFHPGLKRIKRMLEERAVGRVVAMRVEVGHYLPDWHPWEDYRQSYSARRELGGGVILDAIHEIDYARWLLGEVELVACLAGKLSQLEIETEDTAAILVRFRDGALGEVHLDYVQRSYSRSCHIIGDEGTIRWDYSRGEVSCYAAATKETTLFNNPPGWEPNDMYVDEMRHFLACLDNSEQPTQDVFEGARVLELALAAKESAAGQTMVRVAPNVYERKNVE